MREIRRRMLVREARKFLEQMVGESGGEAGPREHRANLLPVNSNLSYK